MILSEYTRADSPFYWLQFALNPGDRKQYRKTQVRKDDPEARRKLVRAKLEVEQELYEGSSRMPDAGWHWVEGWLHHRHAAEPDTLRVYTTAWRWLREYLEASEISAPVGLDRETVYGYLDFRTTMVKPSSGRSPCRNTAIGELKLLGRIMDEAVLRELAAANPARRLRIEREETDLKPEIQDEEFPIIYGALASRPPWMFRSFHIGLQTGLRFQDTQIDKRDVRHGRILIDKPKGGRKKEFSIPVYAGIEEMIAELQRGKETLLWSLPEKERALTGLRWYQFFREIGLPHLCFHCTRITFITRGMRAGIPESVMMKMVNHANKLISRIYQRWNDGDVSRFAEKLAIPGPAGAIAPSPPKK